jgi:hypothetical protein
MAVAPASRPGAAPGAASRPVTRFVVMAMLQAARAKRLGLGQRSAYSWGLNRAIFYAAAKQGFRHGGGGRTGSTERKESSRAPAMHSVGDDPAYVDPAAAELTFTIGGKSQTPEDFERQVAQRLGGSAGFAAAWREAETIVNDTPEEDLRSGQRFYSQVYRPRRDVLAAKWSGAALSAAQPRSKRRSPPSKP